MRPARLLKMHLMLLLSESFKLTPVIPDCQDGLAPATTPAVNTGPTLGYNDASVARNASAKSEVCLAGQGLWCASR